MESLPARGQHLVFREEREFADSGYLLHITQHLHNSHTTSEQQQSRTKVSAQHRVPRLTSALQPQPAAEKGSRIEHVTQLPTVLTTTYSFG